MSPLLRREWARLQLPLPPPSLLASCVSADNAIERDEAIERSRLLVTALEEIAGRHGVTSAQVALNWLVSAGGDTVVAIPGASKPAHAQESAGAMAFALTDE